MAEENATTFNIHNIPVKQFQDRSAKWLLSIRENVRGLFEILAVEWVDLLDFDQMEQVNTSFISDAFQAQEADIVYQIPFRGKSETDRVYIHILIEHQSTVDIP